MSDEHVLTKATAEQYVANPSVVDIKAFKSIDDDAADFLGRFCKQSLAVDGVARMTPLQAASLSRIPGALFLRGLTTLDEATAESLAHNVKTLDLSGLSHISAEAAAALGRHQGDQLRLNGLTAIDDTSATGPG